MTQTRFPYLSNRRQLMFLLCAITIVALIFSRFMITVGMIGLITLSLFTMKEGRLRWNWNFKDLKLSSPLIAMLGLTLFFWIVLVSGLWSEDMGEYMDRLRVKLPFLLLPVAFLFLPRLSERQVIGLFYVLIGSSLLSTMGVLITYAQDPETYNLLIKQGQNMPTPVNHIRYSLLLALASIAGIILGYQRYSFRYKWEPLLLFLSGLLLFLFLHFLAVRSGLVAAYAALLVISLFVIIRQKNWWAPSLIILSLIALPVLSYFTFPSFFQKMNYAKYDIEQLMKGEGDKYSDATRIRSYVIGGQIFLDHHFIGVGAGDLRQEMEDRFRQKYPESSKYILPHNQFLTTLAATGFIGFLLFLTAFMHPLLEGRWKRSLLFLNFQVIAFLSFMVENTLENSVGVAFYCLFTIIFLSSFDLKNFRR